MSTKKTVNTAGKPKNTQETPAAETTEAPAPKKPLSWKEKLALLPEDEAKAMREKAAEASRRSKAKKRGTNPEKAAVDRLEARLTKIDTQLAELKDAKVQVTADLKEARKALVAAEKANPTIGMAEAGDDETFPATEEEYTDGTI